VEGEKTVRKKRAGGRWWPWAGLLFFLLGVVIMSPMLLRVDRVRLALVQQFCTSLQCDLLLQELRWQWLPLPHLALVDLKVGKDGLSMDLPKVDIYPNWRTLLGRAEGLGSIHLARPVVRLFLPAGGMVPGAVALPKARFQITDGTLLLETADQPATAWFPGKLTVTAVSGTLQTTDQGVRFALAGGGGKALAHGQASGFFSLADFTFQADLALKKIDLTKALAPKLDLPVRPDHTPVDLAARLEGRGLEKLTVKLTGQLPGLISGPSSRVFAKLGQADLLFSKAGDRWQVDLNSLESREPGLRLHGMVAREPGAAGEAANWTLDLLAEELDLAALRQATLDTLGTNEIARTVDAIVLGGTAQQANYRLHGPASDFKHLEKMEIRVAGIKAPIHVPGADLTLREARGDITIINGYLAGQGLTAWLDHSYGSNCDLYLDLTDRDHAFRLALDIAADLTELPPVLHKLVSSAPFQEELAKFSEVRGTAHGRLLLGETLDHIETRVQVGAMQGGFSYAPIAWPIVVQGGRLDIAPDTVRWEEVRATGGAQKVTRCTGTVNWTGTPRLTLTALDGDWDAATLLREIKRHDALLASIDQAISSAAGRLITSNTTMQGPALEPRAWHYAVGYDLNDLEVTSPLLPDTIVVETMHGALNQESVTMSAGKIRLQGQPLLLDGTCLHNMFENWTGEVKISGLVEAPLADWIREKGWIPDRFFPAIPCRLDQLTLNWAEGATSLVGAIHAAGGPEPLPYAFLDLEITPSALQVNLARFYNGDDQGELTLWTRATEPRELRLTWQGELAGTTLDQLLATNSLLGGHLSGDMQLELRTECASSYARGRLTLSGLHLPVPGHDTPFTIFEASLAATGQQVRIERLRLGLNDEPVNFAGLLTLGANGLLVDLEARAEALQWAALAHRFFPTRPPGTPDTVVPPASIQPPWNWDVLGAMSFRVDALTREKARAKDDTNPAPAVRYTWAPVAGRLALLPGVGMRIDVSQASLCSLAMAGTWFSDPGLGTSTLLITTDQTSPPLFQEVLLCLGKKDELIEGPFQLNASLQHEHGHWTSGQAELRSPGGSIKRLTLLSKVFSILNVTDMFSGTSLQDMAQKGFKYSSLDIESTVQEGRLFIDQAVVKGDGLTLFARGGLDLDTMETDMTLLVSPFKTVDRLIASVPILGKALVGKNTALVTIPFGVTGRMPDPDIQLLPAQAVSESILNLVTNTLKLPFTILSPMMEKEK